MSSASTEEALSHLNKIKPLGAWSAEIKGGTVRLLRRRVPTTDNFFLDLHYDPTSGCVVGILSKPNIGRAQGQVIVDKDGQPTAGSKVQIVVCSSYDPNKKSLNSSTPTNASSRSPDAPLFPTLSEEDNKKLLLYGLYAVVVATILKMLLQSLFMISLLLLPCVYLYAIQTCPAENSFDAKKELRRVLRGHHLPENHEAKPKSWLDKTIARVGAAVTTELATGLGYEISMMVRFVCC